MEAELEIVVEIEGYCSPGHPPKINCSPEHADPGDPGDVENLRVYAYSDGKKRVDITGIVSKRDLEIFEENLLIDFEDVLKFEADVAIPF